jgi:hypothetical protein
MAFNPENLFLQDIVERLEQMVESFKLLQDVRLSRIFLVSLARFTRLNFILFDFTRHSLDAD